MMKETIAKQAKRLLSPIPDEKWIKNYFTNGIDCCCAVGHFERLRSKDPSDFDVANCRDMGDGNLRRITKNHLGYSNAIIDVNNGAHSKYQQSTPKERVMALIEDLISAGY